MRHVAASDIACAPAGVYRAYLQHFVDARKDFGQVQRSFGVPIATDILEARRVQALRKRVLALGARSRNDGKSIVWGQLSPACARCRTGVKSVSEFISLACSRSCWFCFNSNQHDFKQYRKERKDWKTELSAYSQQMDGLDFVALTGGEPLLFPDETLEFFRTAQTENPRAHARLYTSGDGLTPALLAQLAQAGLNEIRFSVKLDDSVDAQEQTLNLIEEATKVIPSVMVEMPVIPGTHDQMIALLQHLEACGAFGINLLELCFPLHNAAAYKKRGFKLKADPYAVLYDYGYAGALPVAGSEELALRLMEEEITRGTKLGLHYCSLENKNTAQLYDQNGGGSRAIPLYTFSHRSFFYETLRCFGPDAVILADALDTAGCNHAYDEENSMVQFAPEDLAAVKAVASSMTLFLASAVIERDESGAARFREVDIQVLEDSDCDSLSRALTMPLEEG
ncbi:MAG: radical SAM protein [Eggerthellales bacterium]|nr:radical SAM protein [Eggerthellales bacterium]